MPPENVNVVAIIEPTILLLSSVANAEMEM